MPAYGAIFGFYSKGSHSVVERSTRGVREVAQVKLDFWAVKGQFCECPERNEPRSGPFHRLVGLSNLGEINTAGVPSPDRRDACDMSECHMPAALRGE